MRALCSQLPDIPKLCSERLLSREENIPTRCELPCGSTQSNVLAVTLNWAAILHYAGEPIDRDFWIMKNGGG